MFGIGDVAVWILGSRAFRVSDIFMYKLKLKSSQDSGDSGLAALYFFAFSFFRIKKQKTNAA